MRTTSLLHTQTLTRALEFALAKGGFGRNAQHRKTAITLLKEMKSNKSVSGRYQQLMRLLQKGATIDQMMKATGASRRTMFRYLNHFEDAGFDLAIEGGAYRIK